MKPTYYEPGQKLKDDCKLVYLKDTRTVKKTKKKYTRYALFECECGTVKEMDLNSVKHGSTVSCGCHKDRQSKERLEKMREGVSTVGNGVLDMELDDVQKKGVYHRWRGMLRRCYSQDMEQFYSGITVTKEWLKFSNFFTWMSNQKYREGYQLDKDILWTNHEGGKVYSPEYCCLVPDYINNCLLLSMRARGDLPVGVSRTTYKKNPYKSQIKNSGKARHIGYFPTPEEAHFAWQLAKVEQLKCVLDRYMKEESEFVDYRVVDAIDFRINKISDEMKLDQETTIV